MKLTKAQSKRFDEWAKDKLLVNREQVIVDKKTQYVDKPEIKQHLAEELSRQKKEIIKLAKEAEEAGDRYGTFYELLRGNYKPRDIKKEIIEILEEIVDKEVVKISTGVLFDKAIKTIKKI